MLVGDLNARHTHWRNNRNNRRGNTLFDYVQHNFLELISTDTPSHFPANNMRPTYIDLFVNKHLRNLSAPLPVDELSSDHIPIILKWQTNLTYEDQAYTYIYKNVDWRNFRSLLNTSTTINNQISSPEELETEVQKITTNIQKARDKTASKVKIKHSEDRPMKYLI